MVSCSNDVDADEDWECFRKIKTCRVQSVIRSCVRNKIDTGQVDEEDVGGQKAEGFFGPKLDPGLSGGASCGVGWAAKQLSSNDRSE